MEFPKKRGRKPKGGKIVECFTPLTDNQVIVQNVVLHLRCRMAEFNHLVPEEIEPFIAMDPHALIEEPCDDSSIYTKLKSLAVNLHNNDIGNHKADCFWCTCPFDSPTVHIPKCKTTVAKPRGPPGAASQRRVATQRRAFLKHRRCDAVPHAATQALPILGS